MIAKSIQILRAPSVANLQKHLEGASVWKALVYCLLTSSISLLPLMLLRDAGNHPKLHVGFLMPICLVVIVFLITYVNAFAIRKVLGKSNYKRLFYAFSLVYAPVFFIFSIGVTLLAMLFTSTPNLILIILLIPSVAFIIYAIRYPVKETHEAIITVIHSPNPQELDNIFDEIDQIFRKSRLVVIVVGLLMSGSIWVPFFGQIREPSPFSFNNVPLQPSISQEIDNR